MNWSEFLLFLLNWDWFDLIRAIYSSVSCPNFCCHSCTTLIKVAWIRVGKISKHKVYNMKELRKSKKWHETLKCSNQFKKTQNQLKQIESWSGYFFLPTKPCLAPSEPSGIMLNIMFHAISKEMESEICVCTLPMKAKKKLAIKSKQTTQRLIKSANVMMR